MGCIAQRFSVCPHTDLRCRFGVFVRAEGMNCIWRRNFHKSSLLSMLFLHRDVAAEGTLSLLSASSNGLLVVTHIDMSSESLQVQASKQSVVYDGGRRRPVFCLMAAYDLVFAGTGGNEVRAWRIGDWSPVDLKMGGHTGWVRDVVFCKNVMFSAACNFIKVWELRGAFEEAEEATGSIMDVNYVGDIRLFKGDILALAVGDQHLYCGTADGFLHSWRLPDELWKLRASSFEKAASVKAHSGRITSLLYADGKLVSAGDDGCIGVWSGASLQPIVEASSGQKIHGLASAGSQVFSGRADHSICKWSLQSLSLNGILTGHKAPVKSLVAASSGKLSSSEDSDLVLASGGADGEICLWCKA